MERLVLTAGEIDAGLRMMKAVALADGELAEREVHLVAAAARALGALPSPEEPDAARAFVEALATVEPGEVARAIVDPLTRERAVQACILVAMIDGAASPDEVRAIERFAGALGVDEPRVANLRQLARGQVRRMWIDLARRSFAKPIFEDALAKRGLAGVWKIVGPMIGLAKDPDLARRYADLGRLDEGTLGRAYFRFIVDNDLGFPGEGIVAEEGVWHDVSHVLSGYDTTPEGEVDVVSFIAGYRREDPFFWIFTIALQFHLGVRVSPYSPRGVWHFDPERVAAAMKRGMAMTCDISRGWDHWAHVERPLADVRRELGVV